MPPETDDLTRECTSETYKVPLVTFQHIAARAEEIKNVIRRRAYELFEARCGQNGNALADWSQAEAELLVPAHREVEEFPDRLEVNFQIADFLASQIHLSVDPMHVTFVGARDDVNCKEIEFGLDCRTLDRILIGHISLPVRVDSEKATSFADLRRPQGFVTKNLPVCCPVT